MSRIDALTARIAQAADFAASRPALINSRTGEILARRVTLRRKPWELALGLMFRRSIGKDEAMVFCLPRAGVREAGVHMLCVRFPIAILWLDEDFRVVDKALGQPWRSGYRPSAPARYFVEAHPSRLDMVWHGDDLQWQ